MANNSYTGPHTCTYEEDFKRYLLPIVYATVFLFGLPFNSAIILRTWRSEELRSSTVYMLNLAVADLLYVSSLPLLVFYHGSQDYWPFGELACKLVRFQFYSNLHASIFFLTAISLQRCLGICQPLGRWRRQDSGKVAWVVSGTLWVVVLALCSPTLWFATTGLQRNRTVCYDLSEPARALRYFPYGMALTCLGFAAPFLALVACYCRTAWVLCRGWKGAGPGAAGRDRKQRAVRMIAVVVAVFAVSFLPFHLTKTMYLLVRSQQRAPCRLRNMYSVIYKSTRPFASLNSIMDPFLFYFTQLRRRTRTHLHKMAPVREG